MPSTLQDVETATALLQRRELRLTELQAQVSREREGLRDEMKKEFASEFAKLNKLRAEVDPKIAALKKAEQSATAEIEKLKVLQAGAAKQQEILDRTMADLTAQTALFNSQKAEFTKWQKEENVRLDNEKSLIAGMGIKLKEQEAAYDAKTTQESARLSALSTSLDKRSAEMKGRESELENLIQEAKRKDLILTGQIAIRSQAQDARDKKLDARENDIAQREKRNDEREIALTEREQRAIDLQTKNEEERNTIKSARIHLENAELKLAKTKKEVELAVESGKIKDELRADFRKKLKD